jgi:dTDP-4-amino-4,6-dideoxygalactose transaminase
MTTSVAAPIAFVDLAAQRNRLGGRIEQAIARVLEHGQFIMGPEVAELERRLADYCGAAECVTCANGTDALELAMAVEEIGPGDAVFAPALTFIATVEAVPRTGATPIFVDVLPDTCLIDPASLQAAAEHAVRLGLKPRLVVSVDLYGQPADYRDLAAVAARYGMKVIADAAQSFGASLDNRMVGTLADWTTISFYPAKPLGCYGDGGAIFTNSAERADTLRSLRFHGRSANDKNDNVRVGRNSRLDTIQAAVLIEKLTILDEEIEARQRIARRYEEGLAGAIGLTSATHGATSVWAYYTVVARDRERVAASCRRAGVPTIVCYPIPLNRQEAYRHYPTAPAGVAVAERLAGQVLSLPMHPYLDQPTQDRVIDAVLAGCR